MITDPPQHQHADPAADARTSVRMSRRITATWWYTFVGVLLFETLIVFPLTTTLIAPVAGPAAMLAVILAGAVWVLSTIPALLDYRSLAHAAVSTRWRRAVPALALAIVFGVLAGLTSGVWIVAAVPLAETLVLLKWPPGIRLRLVCAVTLLLAALWFIDSRFTVVDGGGAWVLMGWSFTVLPTMTVLTLWWWDVLVALDESRAAEARLGATQERLRMATDVHDLQGHHLQVIALQLELAERLMAHDPDAALAHVRAARASVDDARQGTRDLALRFRSASLHDELANAVDLLRAAGMAVEASISGDADAAPGDVLAPVVRETTTNVLRHGAGAWARVVLAADAGVWRFEIANDPGGDLAPSAGGSGLDGIRRRMAEAGGTVEVRRERGSFTIIVTVPTEARFAR